MNAAEEILLQEADRLGLNSEAYIFEFFDVPPTGPEPGLPEGSPAAKRLVVRRGSTRRIVRILETSRGGAQ